MNQILAKILLITKVKSRIANVKISKFQNFIVTAVGLPLTCTVEVNFITFWG